MPDPRQQLGSPVCLHRLIALLLLMMAVPSAFAHKLNVFASADGARIDGSAYFAGGAKATGAKITITDAAGEVCAKLTPAADGSFSYQATAPVEHRVIAESIDGHRAEWRITAAELAGAFPDGATPTPDTAAANWAHIATAQPRSAGNQPMANVPTEWSPALDAAIESAVARQLRPLREELLATRDALRLQDILGGIGYIFGLTGLALWWHSRHPRERG